MRPFDLRLLRAVPETRRPVAVLAVVGVLQGLAALGSAVALTALVVALVRGGGWGVAAAWFVAVAALRALLAYAAERVAADAGARVTGQLRSRLLDAWLRRGADERPDPARAVALAVQGVNSVEPYVARHLPALVGALVLPPLAIVAMAFVDWLSALIVVLTVPLLPVFAALIGRTTQEETQRRWVALSALSGHFLDVVRGLPTLVAYGRARRQERVIAEVSQRHRHATMATLRLAFLSSAALELLATISVALVAVTVGVRLAEGHLGLGAGLLAILLAPEAYWPIRRMGTEFHAAADGAEALETILPEIESGAVEGLGGRVAAESPSGVRAVGLTYRHAGSHAPAFADLSLAAPDGLTVVTGPSGAGKTTLLEVLAGQRTPEAGSVVAPDAHLVTQRPFLLAGSVADNLRLSAPDATDAQLWGVLHRVGLDGLVAGLPGGLGARLGDDGFGLSAGQRARLALARALLSPAPLLLLDEPTAHLDPESAALVHDVVAQEAGHRTVVAVTHQHGLRDRADHHVEVTA